MFFVGDGKCRVQFAAGLILAVGPASSRTASATSDSPSSWGRGEGQVRIASSQVAANASAPMPGTTATGRPDAGTSRNQGRVGLCQKGLKKPEK